MNNVGPGETLPEVSNPGEFPSAARTQKLRMNAGGFELGNQVYLVWTDVCQAMLEPVAVSHFGGQQQELFRAARPKTLH